MGHSVTVSFFIDQNIFVMVMIAVPLLLGLGIIVYGLYIRVHGITGSPEQWRKDLIIWRILGPNTWPQTLTDVKRCRDYLLSMSILGSGICLVLTMVGWFILALETTLTASADATDQNNGAVLMASMFLSVGIGLGVGAVFAAWRLRNTAKQSITYADLRQRRLSDYRNNAFRWLVMAMIVWTSGVLLFFAPHIGPTLQISLLYTVLSVPNTLWGLSIIPGIMLLVFIAGEIVLLRIVGFSRLLVTADTTVSQHADDMLRAIVIGSVQYCELLASGQLVSLPFSMLSQRLWASHYWQIGHLPYDGLLTVSLFMPVAMQVLGLGILLGRGRLGGKLSGWPWQTRQIKQFEAGL